MSRGFPGHVCYRALSSAHIYLHYLPPLDRAAQYASKSVLDIQRSFKKSFILMALCLGFLIIRQRGRTPGVRGRACGLRIVMAMRVWASCAGHSWERRVSPMMRLY